MSDIYAEIHGSTTCAVCEKKRRCKRTSDKSKVICFRESAEKVRGYTRVAHTEGVSTYIDDALYAKQEAEREAKAEAKSKKNEQPKKKIAPPPPATKSNGRAFATRDEAIKAAEKSTGGKLAGTWEYNDSFAVARFDTDDGKQFRPLSRDKSGWRLKDPSGPLPLYRAGNLPAGGRIYIVEGEKCADAAIEIGLNAITSAHGAKSAAKTDWKPLNGVAEVVILPDNDPAGGDYVVAICKALAEQLDSPPVVKSVKLPGLPSKGDICEFIEARDSRTSEEIAAEIQGLADKADSIDLDYLGGGLHVVTADQIEPKAVEWLWPNRIPLGKLTVLAGDPKVGKSVLAVDLTARVSSGARWPDQLTDYNRTRRAIVFSAEDDAADTIIPRLIAAEANLGNVLICQGVKSADGPGDIPFTIDAHLRQLERMLKRTANVGLIIIDPISAFIGGKVDSHNNSDVRGLLAPLAKLAADHGVAVVLVTHLNKGGGGKAIYRAMGSLAFTAAARAVWMVTREKDSDRVLMLNAGMNLARCPGGLAYTIEDRDGLPVLAWESGPVEMDADEALAVDDQKQRSRPKLGEAIEFVRDALAAGPMKSNELTLKAIEAEISDATLERAKKTLEVVSEKQRGERHAAWIVSLPSTPPYTLDDVVEGIEEVDGVVRGQVSQLPQEHQGVLGAEVDSGNGNQWVDRG